VGKKPDEIERDIKAHREHITQRVEGLQHRVQDDMKAVRSEATGRASHAFGGAKGKVNDARGTLNFDSVKSLVEEHTVPSLAGALGAGMLLGKVSGGGNGHPKQSFDTTRSEFADLSDTSASTGDSSNGGGGGISGLLTSMFGPAANKAQEEFQDLIHEGFALVKEQIQQARGGARGDRTPNSENVAAPSGAIE
jgi:hypothetical protein